MAQDLGHQTLPKKKSPFPPHFLPFLYIPDFPTLLLFLLFLILLCLVQGDAQPLLQHPTLGEGSVPVKIGLVHVALPQGSVVGSAAVK